MGETVRTRRASLTDLDAIVPLFDGYRQFYGQPSNVALARAFLEARLSAGESVVFLAEDGSGAVGFTQLYPSFSSLGARRNFILNDLFVEPSARRQGVARRLIEAAAAFGRSAGAVRLTLSTAVDNITAQSVYHAAGWKRDEAFLVYNLVLEV